MFGWRGGAEADPDGYVQSFYESLQPESEWLDKAGRLRGFLQGAQAEAVAAAAAAAAMGVSVNCGSMLIDSNGSGVGASPVGMAAAGPAAAAAASSGSSGGLRRPRVAVVTSGSVAVPLVRVCVYAMGWSVGTRMIGGV